ncbi:MAG: indolepyruvate oxidoreductase subunit beta [Desulfuromonadaceae bacterium]|nr:indolepyruvate oxidoreductase subunit beta [Desulfuromonadaceae bacterium]
MSDQKVVSVVLAGVGGQGILLASEIIAEAALLSGLQVKTNEVHGMAQRGGSVVAQIRFGREVFSPLVPEGTAQVLAALEKVEALRYHRHLAPDGMAIVSTQEIIPVSVSSGQAVYPADADERLKKLFPRLLLVDALKIATELGSPRSTNVIIVGALSHCLSLDSGIWNEALRRRIKPALVEVNQRAFAAGRSLAAASGR